MTSPDSMMILSFVMCLLAFVGIGLASSLKKQADTDDYLLACRNVKPWLAALSAVATYNSGFMFVGQIGFTYLYGLSSIWLMIGWVVGDFLISLWVHPRFRAAANKGQALTFIGALADWSRQLAPSVGQLTWFRRVGGCLVVLLLGGYAAAQLAAGSKALHVLFGWDYSTGAIIGAIMVLAYCWAGGIRASIWTDAAQSIVMFGAMAMMCWVGVKTLGGWASFTSQLQTVSPTYMDWFTPTTHSWGAIGPWLFTIGWLFGGIGVIGQPHVMVRFMTLEDKDDSNSMARTRFYYYLWYSLFGALTLLTAMAARLLLTNTATFDAELALPMLAQELMPPVAVGLVLAGLFAATMSTADSQILSCSAALTEDVTPKANRPVWETKGATLIVTVITLLIALNASENVFDLVILSAGTMASLFSPLMIVLAARQPLTQRMAFTMMAVSVAVHLSWRFSPLVNLCYEILPGILSGVAVYYLLSSMNKALKPAK